MSTGLGNPKAALHIVAQRHKLELLFSCEPRADLQEGVFQCTLTVSGIPGTATPATFRGSAARKKAAEAAAAAEALAHLETSGIQTSGTGSGGQCSQHKFAWEALVEACATRSERELRFLCDEAERKQAEPSFVPVSAALATKAVARWCEQRRSPVNNGCSEHGENAPWKSLLENLRLVARDLRGTRPPPEAPIDISADGLEFRRRLVQPPRAQDIAFLKQMRAQEGEVRAVVVPCDPALAMEETSLDTGQPHLDEAAAALGVAPRFLLHHGKAGVPIKPQMLLHPGGDERNPASSEAGRVQHLPSLYTATPPSFSQQHQGEAEAASVTTLPPLNLRASWLAGFPVLGNALFAIARINKGNGGTVWGDFGIGEALRLWAEWFPEARMAAALGAPELFRLPTSFSPFAWGPSPKPRVLLQAACLGLCLSTPSFVHGEAPPEGGARCEAAEEKGGLQQACTVTTTRLPVSCERQRTEGEVIQRTATAPRSDADDDLEEARERLEEQAALLLLPDLQAIAASRLSIGRPEAGDELLEVNFLASGGQMTELNNVQVNTKELSGIRQIGHDSVVHVSFKAAPHSDTGRGDKKKALDEKEPCRFVVVMGTGMLDPAIEGLLLKMKGVGGRAFAELNVSGSCCPLGGDLRAGHRLIARQAGTMLSSPSTGSSRKKQVPLLVSTPRILMELAVKYIRGTAHDAHGGIFCPSLAQQRYSFVEGLLKRFQPNVMLDVGCGDGALVEHLVGSQQDLSAINDTGHHLPNAIIGVDVSEDALRRASHSIASVPLAGLTVSRLSTSCSELSQLLTAAVSPNIPAKTSPQVVFLRQDFTQGAPMQKGAQQQQRWCSALTGCDMVVMVEVIEHLDPEPLQHVAPVLLGCLHPMICVVTTPNIEYNAIIRHVAHQKGSVNQARLRNSDHRFEWTRAEFQAWATAAATEFGYKVSFEGVGRAVKEAETLIELATERGVEHLDLGAASQVAIFVCQSV